MKVFLALWLTVVVVLLCVPSQREEGLGLVGEVLAQVVAAGLIAGMFVGVYHAWVWAIA